MNSIIQTPNLALTLAPDERTIVLAGVGQKFLKDMGDNQILSGLSSFTNKALFEMGQQPANQEFLKGFTAGLLKDLRGKRFMYLSMADIGNAFHFGVRKEFGEFYGINNSSAINWVKSYMVWEARIIAKKKQDEYMKEQNKPKEITQEEKESIMWEAVKNAYEKIKSGEFYNDPGNSVYTFLDGKNKLLFNNDRKKQFIEIAFDIVKSEKSGELKNIRSNDVAMIIKREIAALESKSGEVVVQAKKIAINTFFKEMIEIGTDINELKN